MGRAAATRARVSQAAGSEADALLKLAVEAATGAGQLLAERARGGAERQVTSKSTPTDLVSEADVLAERTIRELIARARPQDGFVGEEGDDSEGTSGLSWVVDPLDGTVNFLFAIPQWSVSVAVRDRAGTLAGAVYDPNRDELFTATRDGAATLTSPRGTVELRGSDSPVQGASGPRGDAEGEGRDEPPAAELASAMLATGLAYDAEVRVAQGRVLARLVGRVRDIRRFGSAALDLAWTAAGRYDAYFERSVHEWDIAAGVLICERAGLRVLELPVGEHLPWGILVARPSLAQPLHELVKGP